MADLCNCTSKYANTGESSCIGSLIKASRKLIAVSKYKNDGTLNKIDATIALNSAYVTALLNNADRSIRWYPLPKHVNAEITKSESVYDSFADGSKKFIHEGVSNFKCVYPSKQPSFLSILKSGRCTDIAFYIVDKNGSIVGLSNGEENVVYPFALNENTIDAIIKWATDTTGTNIEYMFEFDVDQKDEQIVKIDASNFVGVNLLNIEGLIDAKIKYTSTGATSMVFKLYANGGDVVNPPIITGLLSTDFALYNKTTSLDVTPSALTEVEGVYTLTYPPVTVGHILRLTPTKARYDFTNVVASTSVVV